MTAPGLVKTEIFDDGGDVVTIIETWDTSDPGCPIVLVRFDPFLCETSPAPAVIWRHISRHEYEQMNLLDANTNSP